jgi:serine/threonine protein kinase
MNTQAGKPDSNTRAGNPYSNTRAGNIDTFARALKYSYYFNREMICQRKLGDGADGEVYAWQHTPTSQVVAVKTPRQGSAKAVANIRDEGRILGRLRWHGGHNNISNMLEYHQYYYMGLPAIISEFAHYGDVIDYRFKWQQQEAMAGRACGIRESSVWKLFRDMVLALDWLHNECKFIHRDIKPDNILVTRPTGYTGELVPTEPLFKLCDFSRSWDATVPSGRDYRWAGTTAYRPAATECRDAARPASDLYSLGATLQQYALGVSPMRSRSAIVVQLHYAGQAYPNFFDDDAWQHSHWQWEFCAMFRPLNLSAQELLRDWHIRGAFSASYRPFSDELNEWYSKLFLKDYEQRITARELAVQLVPHINRDLLTTTNRVDSGTSTTGYDENFPALPAANN